LPALIAHDKTGVQFLDVEAAGSGGRAFIRSL
jgi:hypothetical protein